MSNTTTGGRWQIAMQSRHPTENLFDSLSAITETKFLNDLVKIFPPNGSRVGRASLTCCGYGFEQPKDLLNCLSWPTFSQEEVRLSNCQ